MGSKNTGMTNYGNNYGCTTMGGSFMRSSTDDFDYAGITCGSSISIYSTRTDSSSGNRRCIPITGMKYSVYIVPAVFTAFIAECGISSQFAVVAEMSDYCFYTTTRTSSTYNAIYDSKTEAGIFRRFYNFGVADTINYGGSSDF